jgi:hypothetical protein
MKESFAHGIYEELLHEGLKEASSRDAKIGSAIKKGSSYTYMAENDMWTPGFSRSSPVFG